MIHQNIGDLYAALDAVMAERWWHPAAATPVS
jgi:hypothetical protein